MYTYNKEALSNLMEAVLQAQIPPDSFSWLLAQRSVIRGSDTNISAFNTAFMLLPRKVGKALLQTSTNTFEEMAAIRPNFRTEGWSVDKFGRVWLLLQLPTDDEGLYINSIENLFLTGEMQELVALYAALPVLAYPQAWRMRCADGIRSNIGTVLEAIMCSNPYPSEQLDDKAWNQLVLKAFFTEKPVHAIIGLDSRANKELAYILSDYAHERWAAHRTVNPLLWRCVGPFLDDYLIRDIEKLFKSGNETDKEAAALACAKSNYLPAQQLLEQNIDYKNAIATGAVTWTSVAAKASSAA